MNGSTSNTNIVPSHKQNLPAYLLKQMRVLLAVVIQAADQLLACKLRKVTGEGQVANGLVRALAQVQAALVPAHNKRDGLMGSKKITRNRTSLSLDWNSVARIV